MSTPLWAEQFGSDFAVPAEILAYHGIVDTSWGNDAAPTFTLKRYERDGDLAERTLWVNHPDESRREFDGSKRFMVTENPPDYDALKFVTLYDGDDATLALSALEMATPKQIDLIADEFCKRLRAALTPQQIATVRTRNLLEQDANVCHSHDFCDANVYMAEAYAAVIGHEPLLPMDAREDQTEMIERDCAIMNAAWALAKQRI